jgi:diguanylate cyclase
MTPPNEQQHSTLATAQAAFDNIRSRGQAADPRSYAIWYRYAAGESGLLSAAVNTRLARSGTLTLKDIEDLYSAHISPVCASRTPDSLGTRAADEIEQVMATVAAAERSSSIYAQDLSAASRRLGTTTDRDGLRAVVESLLAATRTMAATNARLQLQLQAMWEEVAQLRRELEATRQDNLTDALTSLGNRKFFNTALEKAIAECRAANEPLSLIVADVDHFKSINEKFGNVVGDRVLRFVATTLKDNITGKDVAARHGGEEFAVILPRTPLFPAVKLAEQLRHAVMKAELIKRSTGEKHTRLTISVGVAALHKGASAQALIEAADICLHAAKRNGRNCVVSEADEKLFAAVTG